MKKRMGENICLFCMICCLFCGCKIESDKVDLVLDEVDDSAEHIKLELGEQVTVDADVTPGSFYQAGLPTYYGKEWSREFKKENFEKNPDFMDKSLSDIIDKMRAVNMGDFSEKNIGDALVTAEEGLCVEIPDEDGNVLLCSATDFEKTGKYEQPRILFPKEKLFETWMGQRMEKENTLDLHQHMDQGGRCIEEAKELVSYLCDVPLSDHYIWLPLGEEDSYALYLFPEIKGLPIYMENCDVEYKDSAKLSESVIGRKEILEHVSYIKNLMFHPYIVYIENDSIAGLEINASNFVGEEYEKAAPVIGLKDILEEISNYYRKNYIEKDIVITDIELAYNGYVNDGSNGREVVHTVQPFWYVRYYDPDEESGSNRCLLFDAYTGKFVTEQSFLN